MKARYNSWTLGITLSTREYYPWTPDFDSRALEITHGHWRVESLKVRYNLINAREYNPKTTKQ